VSLPPIVEHRVWWIWPRDGSQVREQFHGKNFYFAVEKAKVRFKVERTQLDQQLCDPEEIKGLTPPSKQEKVDVWRQLGEKKCVPKTRRRKKK
jgi:hypothetical protein